MREKKEERGNRDRHNQWQCPIQRGVSIAREQPVRQR